MFSTLLLSGGREIEDALEDSQIQPFFQPQFDLSSNEVVGFEVLARWCHPLFGQLSPTAFMPLIERSGLLNSLLFSQLNSGLEVQKALVKRGVSLPFSYNLEIGQLADFSLISALQGIFLNASACPTGVTFEVTERGSIDLCTQSKKSLKELKILGFQLSIDDFGTGFSSLERLYQLPFGELKLSSSFVAGVAHDIRCQTIVRSTISLGQSLGMSVVLEGIETEAQRKVLIELGGTCGQGYLYAEPMSRSELLGWQGNYRLNVAGYRKGAHHAL